MYPVSVAQLTIIGSIFSAAVLFGFALRAEITEYQKKKKKKKKQAATERLSWIDGRVLLWFLDNPTMVVTIDFLAVELGFTVSEVRESLFRLEVKQKVARTGEYWRFRIERGARNGVA
jgi:predicted Rossmann fold nucleotide-binding protein DprA/Smf involved in DNA uptake